MKLYKRNRALYLSITKEKRERISLGISTDLGITGNYLNGNSKEAIDINSKLSALYVKVEAADTTDQAKQAIKAGAKVKANDQTLGGWCEAMIESLYSGRKIGGMSVKEGTAKMYTAMLKNYNRYVGVRDIYILENDLMRGNLTQAEKKAIIRNINNHFEGWADFMLANLSPSTARHYLSKCKSLLNELNRSDAILILLNTKIKVKSKAVESWPVWFTSEFLNRKSKNDIELAMKLQILTCARPGDLLALRKENFTVEIRPNGEKLYVVEGVSEKTDTYTNPIVPENLWRACRNQCSPFLVKGYDAKVKYQRYYKGVKSALASQDVRIGSKHISIATTPHMLRKAGVNWYRSNGLDDELIKTRFSGHKNDKVYNEHYVSATGTESELSSIVNKQRIVNI